jgi:hypothetical protein
LNGQAIETIIEPPGKCFWCALNSGNGTPAFRVMRDMGEFKREADICKKCFDAFDGFSLESIKLLNYYPEGL